MCGIEVSFTLIRTFSACGWNLVVTWDVAPGLNEQAPLALKDQNDALLRSVAAGLCASAREWPWVIDPFV